MVKSVYKAERKEFIGTDVNKNIIIIGVCVCIWGRPLEAREQLPELVASYDQGIWDGTQAA